MSRLGNAMVGAGIVLMMIFGSDTNASSISLAGLVISISLIGTGRLLGGGANE